MKKTLLILVVVLLKVSTPGYAGSGGPDAFGYTWKDNLDPNGPVYNWVDLSTRLGTKRVENLSDDNMEGPFQIGFNFHFYWYDVSQIWVGSNGYISFQPCQLSAPFPVIPNTVQPQNFIAAMAADLNFSGAGNIGRCDYWTSPSHDSLVVSWENVPWWDPAAPTWQGSNTFQIILSTVDSSIVFQYQTQNGVYAGGNSPYLSAGIENISGAVGLQTMLNPLSTGTYYFTTPYAVKIRDPASTNYHALDATTLYNDNPDNGGRFISNNTPVPWVMTSEVKNAGNVNLLPFNVYSYVATNQFGTTGNVLVDDTITTNLLTPQSTQAIAMNETFSPTVAQTYLQVTRTLYPGDVAPSNDSSTFELVVVDTTNGPVRLAFDDGISNNVGLNWQGGTGGAGMQFIPPFYPCKITKLHYYIESNPNAVGFYCLVYDDRGAFGGPGVQIDSIYVPAASVTTFGWNDVILPAPIDIQSGSFYVSWNMDGAGLSLGICVDGPFSNRSFEVLGNSWSIYRNREFEDFMINVTIDTLNLPLGITAPDPGWGIGEFYPVPSSDKVYLNLDMKGSKDANVSLELYSADGKYLGEKRTGLVAGKENQVIIDISRFEAGIYYCRILSGGKAANRKFTKLN